MIDFTKDNSLQHDVPLCPHKETKHFHKHASFYKHFHKQIASKLQTILSWSPDSVRTAQLLEGNGQIASKLHTQ